MRCNLKMSIFSRIRNLWFYHEHWWKTKENQPNPLVCCLYASLFSISKIYTVHCTLVYIEIFIFHRLILSKSIRVKWDSFTFELRFIRRAPTLYTYTHREKERHTHTHSANAVFRIPTWESLWIENNALVKYIRFLVNNK